MEWRSGLIPSAVLAASVVLVGGSAANASFVLIDNFGSYAAGSALNGQGGWTAQTGTPPTSVVQVSGSNNAVQPIFNATAANYKNLGASSIPNSSTAATVFWQFSTPSNATTGATTNSTGSDPNNWNFIITDNAAPPDTAGSSDVQFNWDSSSGTARIRNGAAFQSISLNGSTAFVPMANTFYNMWYVINNNANTYKVYIQSNSDPSVSSQTQLETTTGVSTFAFRNTITDSLQTVNLGTSNTVTAFAPEFTNIYADTSGQDLANPVPTPEPASLGVFSLGAFGLLARRRRRG
jgi:hypothetical protein